MSAPLPPPPRSSKVGQPTVPHVPCSNPPLSERAIRDAIRVDGQLLIRDLVYRVEYSSVVHGVLVVRAVKSMQPGLPLLSNGVPVRIATEIDPESIDC